MNDVVRHVFTESDNKTHSIYKYLACACIATAIGLQIYAVVHNSQPFDMQAFGIGVGTLFAGTGAALKMTPESREVAQ